MSILSGEFSYRPEIDGLRAVAVLVVILFHAGLGVPGGFVGVDVFFVISGFLITSLILKDLQQNRFSLVLFWERRARRILPAALVVTLSALVAGWFFLIPRDYVALGRSAAHQAIFSANFYFRGTIGYFNDATDKMPLLHTWSLAVEEQFYMIVPLLLLGLFRFQHFRRRGVLLAVFLSGILVSLSFSCYDLIRHPNAAFYLLHSRAWELLIGSTLAILPSTWVPTRRIIRELLSAAGFVGILVPCFFYGESTAFPGIAALPPCLGAALVIWANAPHEAGLPTLGRVLASRPAVFVGLISYSLYLWHWPLLTFARYQFFEPLSIGLRIGLLGIAFLLSVLSWRFVEMPFRKRTFCISRRSIFIFSGAGLGSVLVLGLSLVLAKGIPSRLAPQARIYAEAKGAWVVPEPPDIEGTTITGNLHAFGNSDPKANPKFLLWGDSHAIAVLPAIDTFLKEKQVAGLAALHAGMPPVLGFAPRRFRDGKCERHNAAVFNYIMNHKISSVFLVARWSYYGSQEKKDGDLTSLELGLLDTVQMLVQAGVHTWVLLQVPEHVFDVPVELARAEMLNKTIDHLCTKPGSWNGLASNDAGILEKLRNAGAQVIDPRPRFLNPTQTHYMIAMNGVALYVDANHVSPIGARMLLLPLFREAFSP